MDHWEHLPLLKIPFKVKCYEASDLIDAVCNRILSGFSDDEGDDSSLVIGFDIEYETETTGQGGPGAVPRARTGQVDVIQICTDDMVYVFKVCPLFPGCCMNSI